MKKTLLSIAAIALASFTFAQTVITDENFDSYTAGQTVSSQGSDFEAWTGAASEEAYVSTDFANSSANSMKIINDNDMIYRFGTRTSGSYDIEFNMLVNNAPTDAAYFNIEHTFGGNYAYSFFFNDNGRIHVQNGNPNVDVDLGTYSKGVWMNIIFHIDLDADNSIMVIDGDTIINEVFSGANNGTPDIQLDVIDFYGLTGSDTITNSLFYIDDFKFTEVVAPSPPIVNINTAAITTDGSVNPTITFSNDGTGGADMNYRAYTVYDDHASFAGSQTSDLLTHNVETGTGYSYGSFTVGTQKKAIVRFYNNHLQNYIGLTIDSIMSTAITGYQGDSVRLFFLDRGEFVNNTGLGNEIYSQTFQGITAAHAEFTLPLTTPYQITGEEVIVGMQAGIGIADTSIFSMEFGTTAMPSVPNCNFGSLGASYTEYPYNYSLYAFVSGTPWPQWLDVTPANGSLAQGGSQDLTLDVNTTGLTLGETYTATVVFGCDDPIQEFSEILVTFTPLVGANENEKIGVLTYPNPTTNYFVIKSDISISSIQVYSVSGQLVSSKNTDSKTAKIDMSNLANGTYYTKIKVGNETITRTIIKK